MDLTVTSTVWDRPDYPLPHCDLIFLAYWPEAVRVSRHQTSCASWKKRPMYEWGLETSYHIVYEISGYLLKIYLFFCCCGSLLLHSGFLWLQRVGLLFVLGPRHVPACLAVERGSEACELRGCSKRAPWFWFWALEPGLGGHGTQAYLLHGMWALRGPGILLMSPSLQGGFLTNGTPGKPSYF